VIVFFDVFDVSAFNGTMKLYAVVNHEKVYQEHRLLKIMFHPSVISRISDLLRPSI